MKKAICGLIITSLLIFGVTSIYNVSEVAEATTGVKKHDIPYLTNPEKFVKPKKGEPVKGIIEVKANGVPLFETTLNDYFKNKEYYQKKFGVGKYWRDKHTPVEPQDIIYIPDSEAKEKGYPKIKIEKDN